MRRAPSAGEAAAAARAACTHGRTGRRRIAQWLAAARRGRTRRSVTSSTTISWRSRSSRRGSRSSIARPGGARASRRPIASPSACAALLSRHRHGHRDDAAGRAVRYSTLSASARTHGVCGAGPARARRAATRAANAGASPAPAIPSCAVCSFKRPGTTTTIPDSARRCATATDSATGVDAGDRRSKPSNACVIAIGNSARRQKPKPLVIVSGGTGTRRFHLGGAATAETHEPTLNTAAGRATAGGGSGTIRGSASSERDHDLCVGTRAARLPGPLDGSLPCVRCSVRDE